MPVDQIAIQALSLPTQVPGSPATAANFNPNTQTNFSALAGSGATPAPMFNDYSTNTADANALVGSGSNAVSSDGITGVAVDQVGGNIGGVVGANVEPKEYKAMIPEDTRYEDAIESQVDTFKRNDKTGGRAGARQAKGMDRRADKEARQEAGLKGSKKRQMRRAQRSSRQEAWKTYKDDTAYEAAQEAADMELN